MPPTTDSLQIIIIITIGILIALRLLLASLYIRSLQKRIGSIELSLESIDKNIQIIFEATVPSGKLLCNMFIIPSHKITIKGLIMETRVQVDETFLGVFEPPVDKYGNGTTLNGDPIFESDNADLVEFRKATQEEIDAYNTSVPDDKADDRIPESHWPYTGAGKTKETTGTTLVRLKGDPTTADDDTPVEGTITVHVGAGKASNFGAPRVVGVKEDVDVN